MNMTINYPNGRPFIPHHKEFSNRTQVASHKQAAKNKLVFGNRGMTLESDINASNETYLVQNIAVIHKKPVPVQIVSVDYPKRSAARITEAYFGKASTTDYNGVYKGKYIDFEAKETKNKQSFPLKNFHAHQIQHMEQCAQHGGISFVLLRFVLSDRIFLLPISKLSVYWNNQKNGGKKSILLKELEQDGYEIQYGIAPRIPYLNAVDKLIELEKQS